MFQFIEKHAITDKNNVLCHLIFLINVILGSMSLSVILPMLLPSLSSVSVIALGVYSGCVMIAFVLIAHFLARISKGSRGIGETYRIYMLTSLIGIVSTLFFWSYGYLVSGYSTFHEVIVYNAFSSSFIKTLSFLVNVGVFIVFVYAMKRFKGIRIFRYIVCFISIVLLVSVGIASMLLAFKPV